MPGAVDIASEIAAAADCLQDGGHAHVAEALRLCLAGASFEAAMGAAPGWRSAAKQRQRDAALVALVRHFENRSVNDLAARIACFIGRYHDTAWQSDRRGGKRPIGAPGDAFDFLAASKPLGAERLRQLLTGMVGNQSARDYQRTAPRCGHGT